MSTQNHEAREVLEERYRLERSLGRGAEAHTWLATDLRKEEELLVGEVPPVDLDGDGIPDEARVVIKMLPFSGARDWEDLELLEKEAEVLSRLDHPGIPGVLGHFFLDREGASMFCLVRQWAPGASLLDRLQRGEPFSEARAREVLWETSKVLHYLHTRKPPVVHRDLKPSNILLCDDGGVSLIDFGAVGEGSSPLSQVVGTFGYMPQEQEKGNAEPASDVYALGATVCHLLCRRRPEDLPSGSGGVALEFRERAQVGSAMASLLDEMLRVDVGHRIQSVQEVMERLDGLDGSASAPLSEEEPVAVVVGQRRKLSQGEALYAFVTLPSAWRYVLVALAIPLLVPPFTPFGLVALIVGSFVARKSFREGRRNREIMERGTLVVARIESVSTIANGVVSLEYVYALNRQSYRAVVEVSQKLGGGLQKGSRVHVAVDPYQPENSVPLLGAAKGLLTSGQ